ncbi:hypothetical protein [Ralstonia phage phiRSL1]|uniref:Uncharacterized protein n=1 Tax=Ralstonia phage phiRSL1 TaxID=1980924 RepID=B2ZXS2_9CAUD|nr:hypothetical protein RSL1_ORF057 [Ralstonia phage phiRSL1]BAG41503.1 hypothetical protein [Ralstonia phage phiRSL1]
MHFKVFKRAIAAQYARMQATGALFRTDTNPYELWDKYLESFPEGTNNVYRTRREYDCNCCRQFVKAVGNVVAVIDGRLQSIWDVDLSKEPGFQPVADACSALVLSKPINNHFLWWERTAGTDKSFERLTEGVQEWDHFHVNLDTKYVAQRDEIPSRLGRSREGQQVFERAMRELTADSMDTVLDLISQNSLYRGEEHSWVVGQLRGLKAEYDALPNAKAKLLFTWVRSCSLKESVLKARNSAIGTLLVDLSAGVDLEEAIKSFESKVAPANYKRPTAVITKAMIEKAKATIEQLGLTSALDRRHATLSDISVNNILFANRDAKQVMTGNVFDELSAETSSRVQAKSLDSVEEVSIEKFVADILPRVSSIEVLLENRLQPNLVSLVAPSDPTSGNLFKWNNNFSWAYAGEVADSIKERVKKAGGRVEGDLCCRLAWGYSDDLDFHMFEPDDGSSSRDTHVFYGNRGMLSGNGGLLDVDANGMDGVRPDPVENIVYADRKKMRPGTYRLAVNNYNRRQTVKTGFEVEIECMGQRYNMAFENAVPQGKYLEVAEIVVHKDRTLEVNCKLPASTTSREVYSLPSQTFHKVNVLMMSPNHWDQQGVGNRHYFFMLDGCQTQDSVRGFFNEFLKEELNVHRKVFEVLGGKMRVTPTPDQLSGLGFSSTQRNSVVCRVKGAFTRTLKIAF